jgi:hypothetical protein
VSRKLRIFISSTIILALDKTRSQLWESVRLLLGNRSLVVIGTSLRDPSIFRLFTEARSETPGFFVVPKFFHATAKRLQAWNLECIDAEADSFLTSLVEAIDH